MPQYMYSVLCLVLATTLSRRVVANPWFDQGFKGSIPGPPAACTAKLRRSIKWGTATSAFQVEGAVRAGGRTPSIWDEYTRKRGAIYKGHNADVACDHYNRFREDVRMMKSMGVKNYRLSISWNRVLPKGFKNTAVSREGVKFYNDLINALLAAGISPAITIFHWDLPQSLQDAYGGFLSPRVADDFEFYADTLFRLFGDRVKNWITLNEPRTYCLLGYKYGSWVPAIRSDSQYLVCGHNMLLAHGKAVQRYRRSWQRRQRGRIGITLDSIWAEPLTKSRADATASNLMMDDELGWFAAPVFINGDYPPSMRPRLGNKLPRFTKQQRDMLRGSADFLGYNHYTTYWVASKGSNGAYYSTSKKNNTAIGPQAESGWLYVVPWGVRKALNYIKKTYKNPEILITENGMSVPKEAEKRLPGALDDNMRVNYYRDYINNVCLAISQDKVRVSTYFAWSLMDNFEWNKGYGQRFGIVHVDFGGSLRRRVKKSAKFLQKNFFEASSARL